MIVYRQIRAKSTTDNPGVENEDPLSTWEHSIFEKLVVLIVDSKREMDQRRYERACDAKVSHAKLFPCSLELKKLKSEVLFTLVGVKFY